MKTIAHLITFMLLMQCTEYSGKKNLQTEPKITDRVEPNQNENMEIITLGAGCFWCVEAIFEQLNGVSKVESGYSGGKIENPTYKAVCEGTTGHAEVCQLTYDSEVISLEEILEVFWQTHDPTTLNQQGYDVGTQYRSAIFYHNEKQKDISEKLKQKLIMENVWPNPVVTEISPFVNFYVAEDYHQEYFQNNQDAPYCRAVIQPKLEKFEKIFKNKLK